MNYELWQIKGKGQIYVINAKNPRVEKEREQMYAAGYVCVGTLSTAMNEAKLLEGFNYNRNLVILELRRTVVDLEHRLNHPNETAANWKEHIIGRFERRE